MNCEEWSHLSHVQQDWASCHHFRYYYEYHPHRRRRHPSACFRARNLTPLGIATATSSSNNTCIRGSIPEEDKIYPRETYFRSRSAPMSRNIDYRTTPEGDVLFVQPSFDDPGRKTPVEASECQYRSPFQGEKQCDLEVRNPVSPRKPSGMHHGHIRQLSAHFFDATSLKENDEQHDVTGSSKGGGNGSDGEGRKHRRIFSGDLSNPCQLHRRLDSRGARGRIQRDSCFHHREYSAGLDILSAAADATTDELADAMGMSSPMITPWEPPSHHQADVPPSLGQVSTESYDSGYLHAMPPPSHPVHSCMSSYPPYMPHSHVPPYPPSHYSYPPPPNYYCPPDSLSHHLASRPPYALQCSSGMHHIYPDEQTPPSRRPLVHSWDHAPQHQRALSPPEGEVSNKQSNHRGSQTFVTAIAVGTGTKTLQPNITTKNASTNTTPQRLDAASSQIRHHRKLSSFSSIGTLLGSALFSPNEGSSGRGPEPRPGGAHHRKTSSTFSFLQGLDVRLDSADDQFLKNLQASVAAAGVDYSALTPQHARFVTSAAAAAVPSSSASTSTNASAPSTASASPSVAAVQPVVSSTSSRSTCADSVGGSDASLLAPAVAAASKAPDTASTSEEQLQQSSMDEEDEALDDLGSRLASGGTSKRPRRYCTVRDCQNRVVQGGKCISHGARRKTCKHPGCNKNVKQAGLCSTHGPARKQCGLEGCSKVAVQGGRCIAHGAKKKLCLVSDCTKQAILSGMCKKHHDQAYAIRGGNRVGGGGGVSYSHEGTEIKYCQEIRALSSVAHPLPKPSHTRGLSIFQEISPDAVNELLND